MLFSCTVSWVYQLKATAREDHPRGSPHMTTTIHQTPPAPERTIVHDSAHRLAPPVEWTAVGGAEHLVQFYETDDFLLDALVGYVLSGLEAGEVCLVLATAAHREGLEARLESAGVDLAAVRREGTYRWLDASTTLARLLREGWPDPERFAQVVGRQVLRALKRGRHVRIFGEMVALLWAEGNRAAAVRLEELWNQFQRRAPAPFTLFCGYALADCAEAACAEPFAAICQQHSQVFPGESYAALADPAARLRTIALLQQQARTLAAEMAERQAAQAAQQHLAAIVASSDDAILSKDLDGVITSWNTAAERMYGYRAEDIVGQSVTLLFPHDRQGEFAQIMERIRRGERVDHYDTLRVCQDGSLLPVSVTVSPIKDQRGTIIGASAIARDISARNALERQREAFLGLVTHELKTPVTSLQANLQLAQRRLTRLLSRVENLDEEQQRTLEDVLTMLGRTQHPLRVQQRLIDDLLDVARLQDDKVDLHLTVCDLVGLVAETVQDHQAAHPARLITLELPEQDPILVSADRDRLQQVLSNYVTNALKFSPDTAPVQIGITLEAGAARVWVQDQGPGLSAEQHEHIWQQYYQVPNTPVQSNGWKVGLGLGLYICRQLIRRQQGAVGVESRPGHGATFWFSLPLHAPSPQEEDARPGSRA
jgi:PAS domain S-box-containing protein